MITALATWDPALHPESCANCRQTIVYGDASSPMARCARGCGVTHGKGVPLAVLLRPKWPHAWRSPRSCDYWESMEE